MSIVCDNFFYILSNYSVKGVGHDRESSILIHIICPCIRRRTYNASWFTTVVVCHTTTIGKGPSRYSTHLIFLPFNTSPSNIDISISYSHSSVVSKSSNQSLSAFQSSVHIGATPYSYHPL